MTLFYVHMKSLTLKRWLLASAIISLFLIWRSYQSMAWMATGQHPLELENGHYTPSEIQPEESYRGTAWY